MIVSQCLYRYRSFAAGGAFTGSKVSKAGLLLRNNERPLSMCCPSVQLTKLGRPSALPLSTLPLGGHKHTNRDKCTASNVAGQDYRATASEDLPRFRVDELAALGGTVSLDGANFKHAARSLRLKVGDRVELCDGRGRVASADIVAADKSSLSLRVGHVSTLAASQQGRAGRWHVVVACASLKGGRSDWLVEKCAELGAVSLRPLLTARSPSLSEHGRVERWARVAEAASKQSLRVFDLELLAPVTLQGLVLEVCRQKQPMMMATPDGIPFLEAFQRLYGCQDTSPQKSGTSPHDVDAARLGAAGMGVPEASPPPSSGPSVISPPAGFLLVGPEGDFTEEEKAQLREAGCVPVSLGPLRLRVETAAVAMLAAAVVFRG